MGQVLKMCVNCENKCGCDLCGELHEWIIEHIEMECKLKAYKDAENEGKIMVIPCKIGDTVYVINKHLHRVFDCKVIGICAGYTSDLHNHIKTRWIGKRGNESIRKWSFRKVGRYVFLNREEAEAALAVKDGENNA